MRPVLSSCGAGLICLSFVLQPATAQRVDVETYSVPVAVEPVIPRFPAGANLRGEEALVEVHFMVDTEGNAFEPVIVDYVGYAGSEVFREAALDALERTRFEPARRNGEAIVGSHATLYVFELFGGSRAASEAFSGQYRNFQQALSTAEQGPIEQALAELEQHGAHNHYEHAYLNLARFNHAARFGSELEQIEHLEGALAGSLAGEAGDRDGDGDDAPNPTYLDAAVATELRRLFLPLLLRHNRFPEALEVYEQMELAGDDEGVAFFAEVIGNVRALEFDETEYAIPLTLGETGSIWVELFKHKLAVTGGEGALVEAKLRCEQQYAAFALERDVSYDVPDAWGDCSMEIIGDAGAAFFLLQL